MPSSKLQIPSVKLGFYYPEILRGLLDYKRTNIPELTDEDEHEPTIQLMRAFATVGHMNNCVADMVAQESLLRTARLTESVREHLKLAGYQLRSAKPAKVEQLAQLSKVFAAPATVIPDGARFATEADPNTGAVTYFEADSSVDIVATDKFTNVIAVEGNVSVDFTAKATSATTPADDFAPWATPAPGDTIYLGHASVMFDRVTTYATTESSDDGFGVWEYHSGDYAKAAPDSVTRVGNYLRVIVDSYLGNKNRTGAIIRVQLNTTTVSQDAPAIWNGSNNIVLVDLLGQSEASEDPADYTIGSAWEELANVTSESGVGDLYFGLDEDIVSWTLPQTTRQRWMPTTVNGASGYWVRFRWIDAPTTAPVMQFLDIADAAQYVIVSCTQGQTFTQAPLGSGTGLANQRYAGQRANYIDGTAVITVDGDEWIEVRDFINSGPADKHFAVELTDDDDTPEFVFGDGKRGAVPPVGVGNIVAVYRYGADQSGNVGPNTLTVDRAGLSFAAGVYNPRQASGWSAAEGSTPESMELAKQLGPATIRADRVALSASDLGPMTRRFTDDNGASPYGRAFAIEESFGPKTVELVTVRKGAALATSDELAELSRFFNGDKFAVPPIPSRFIANQRVIATNYTPRTIGIKARVSCSEDLRVEIENRLRAVLHPEAMANSLYEWEFGGEVSLSRIDHEIHGVSSKITKVEILEPASNILLSFRQLPIAGNIEIEIVKPKVVS